MSAGVFNEQWKLWVVSKRGTSEEFWTMVRLEVLRTVRAMGLRRHDADDAAQNVLLAICRKSSDELNAVLSPRKWVRTVTRRRVWRVWSSNKKANESLVSLDEPVDGGMSIELADTTEHSTMTAEDLARLIVLAKLTPQERQALGLQLREPAMTLEEIGQVFEPRPLSKGRVCQILQGAVRKMHRVADAPLLVSDGNSKKSAKARQAEQIEDAIRADEDDIAIPRPPDDAS